MLRGLILFSSALSRGNLDEFSRPMPLTANCQKPKPVDYFVRLFVKGSCDPMPFKKLSKSMVIGVLFALVPNRTQNAFLKRAIKPFHGYWGIFLSGS